MAMKNSFKPLLVGAALFLIVIGLTAARNNTSNSTAATAAQQAGGEIAWLTDLDAALAESKETGRPVMVDFFATWCPPCKMLDAQTYSDSRVIEASKNWIMVRIDVDKNKALARQYQISSIPTIVLLQPDGKEVNRTAGFIPPGPMLSMLQARS
jgi:thiol:disulfide interchange protein DsbD